MEDQESINKENPREATGVNDYHSNNALAVRDYNLKCRTKHCISIIKGYHIWWCSTHHQPHHICEKKRLEENFIFIKRRNENGK